MAQRWMTKKGIDGRNRHIPIRERSRVREKEIKIPDISENDEYKTIERFSVNGKSYIDAMTKILYGEYKNILLESAVIIDSFFVYGKTVYDIKNIENAGHGAVEYILSKDNKIYELFGYISINKSGIWHINAELTEKK